MSNTPNSNATSVAVTSLFSSPSTTSLASYSTVNMPSQESTNPFQQNKCIRMKIKRNSAGQHMTSTTTHPPYSTSPSPQNPQSCKVTSLVTMTNNESTPYTTCITVSKQQDHIFTYKIHHNMTQNNSNYNNSVTCKNVPLGCLPSLSASPQTSISQISDSTQHSHVTSKSNHTKSLPNKRSKLSHKDHSHSFSKNCNNFNPNSLLLNNNTLNINNSNINDTSSINNNNNIISLNNNIDNINSINKSVAYSFNSNANNNSNSSINFNVNSSLICQKNNNSNNAQRFNNNNNNNNNINNNINNISSHGNNHTIANSNNSSNTKHNNTSGNNNKNSNSSQRWAQHTINNYNTPLSFNEVNTLAYDNCPQCPPNNTDNQQNPLDKSLPHPSNFDETKNDVNKDNFMNNMNNSFGSIINNHPNKAFNKASNNTSFNNFSNMKMSNNQYNNNYHADGSSGAYNIPSNPDTDPYEFNTCREDQGEVIMKKTKVPEKCERGCSPIKNISNKDVEVDACHIGLITDPDCLGPCDPGTSVTLEGIVWNETENGLLVVNVTWRGKTYVGTLMDATKHHWAPPRFSNDSPTSDLDGRTQKGRGKRGRNNNNNSNNNTNNNVVPPPTPQNRNENGSDRKLRSNRNNNKQVQNNATPSPLKISEAKKNRGEIFASSIFQEFSRRASSRSESKALYSESSEDVPVGNYNSLSSMVECPEENCSKKFRNMVGLKYHQSRSHQKQEATSEAATSIFNATTITSSFVPSSKYNEKKNNEVNTKQVNDNNSQLKSDIPAFSNKTFKNSPKAPYDSNEDNRTVNLDKISTNKFKTFDSSKNVTNTHLDNNDQNNLTESDDKESKSDKMNYRFDDKINNNTTKSKNSINADYSTSDNSLHKPDKDHFNSENGLDFESLKSKNNFKFNKNEIENLKQDTKHNFSNSNNFVSNENLNNNNAIGNNLNAYNLNKNVTPNFNLFSMNNKTDEAHTFSNNDNSLSNFSSLNNNHSNNKGNSFINLNEPTLKNVNKTNKSEMANNMEKNEVSLEKKTTKSTENDAFSTANFNNATHCSSNMLNNNLSTNNATLSTIENNEPKGSFLDNSVQQEQSFNFKKSFKNIKRNSPNKDDIENKCFTSSSSCTNLRGFAPLTLEKPYAAKNTNSSTSKNIGGACINNENSVDSNLIYNNNANKDSNIILNSNSNQSIDYPIEKGRKKKRNSNDKNNTNKFYNSNNVTQNNLSSANKNYSKNNNNSQSTVNFKTVPYTTSPNKTPHKDMTALNDHINFDPVSSASLPSKSYSFLSSNLMHSSKTLNQTADVQQYPYSFCKNDNNSGFLNNNNDVLNPLNMISSVPFTTDATTLSTGLVTEASNQNESVDEFLGKKQKSNEDLRNSPSKASSEVTIIHGASSPAYSDISDANENAPMLEKEANETTLVDEDALSERRCSPASINEEKSNQSFVNSPFYRLMPRLTPAVTSPIIQSKENLIVSSSVSADLLTTSNFFCNSMKSFDKRLTGTYYNNDGTLENAKGLSIAENKVNVSLDITKTFNESLSEFKSAYNSKVKEKDWPYLFSGGEKTFNKEEPKADKRDDLFFSKKPCFGYPGSNSTDTNLLSSANTTLSSSASMATFRPFYKGIYSTRESEYCVQMERYALMQQKPLVKTSITSETYNHDQDANQSRSDEQITETSLQTTAPPLDLDNNKSKNPYFNKDSFKSSKPSLFSTSDTSFGSDNSETGASNNMKNNISSGSNRNSFNEKTSKKYTEQGSKGFFHSNQKLQSTPSLSKLYYPGEGGGKPAAVVAPQTRADRLINNNHNTHRNNIANNTNTCSLKVNDTEVFEGKSFQTNRKTPIDESVGNNQESSSNSVLINTHETNSNRNTVISSDNKNVNNQNISYLKSPRESRNTKEDSSSKKDFHKQAKSKSSHSDNVSMPLPNPHSSLPAPFPHSSHSFYSPYLPPAPSYPGVILSPFETSLFPSMAALSYSLHPNQLMHGVPSVGLPPTSSSTSTDIDPKLATTNFFHHRQEFNTTPTSDHHKIHDLKESSVSKVNEESSNQFKESSNSIQTFSTNHSSLVRGNSKDEKEKEEPTFQRHLHTHHHMHVLGPSMYPFLTSEAAAMFTGSQANAVLPSHLSRHSYIGK